MFTIPCTTEQFEAKKHLILDQHNIELRGLCGQAHAAGVTVRYELSNDELTVEVVTKPMFVTDSMVESVVKKWFE